MDSSFLAGLWHGDLSKKVALCLTFVAILVGLVYRASRRRLPLPPGPPSSWLKGPAMPKGIYPWITYARWGEQYGWSRKYPTVVSAHSINLPGDVIYYNTPGTPVLLLNSRQAMSDLLDKRADIYSSRPYRTMVIDM